MKTNFIFAAIAAVAMLASCSKEADNAIDNGEAKAARITIDMTTVGTRAFDEVDQDSDDADKAINNLIVFVTRTDGTLDVSPVYVDGATIEENQFDVDATTKADKIYIVANTGPLATGPFNNVSNLAELKTITMNMDGTGNTASGHGVEPGNVWMSGESTTLEEGTPVEVEGVEIAVKEASIQLYYIPAKVFVVVENSMENYVGGNTLLEGVTITNAGVWTGFVNTKEGTINIANNRPDYRVARSVSAQYPYYLNGLAVTYDGGDYEDMPALVEDENDYDVNAIFTRTTGFDDLQTAAGATNKADLTEADAIYIFPAQIGDTEMVWASIYGTYTNDDATTQQTFWSIPFGGEDATVLESGNKYIVTLRLKGNANVPGEEDPTVETVDSILEIEVIQAAWNVSNPDKTFN